MEQLGLGRTPGRTPGSGRKISHSDYVRAIAAADTPLRTLNTDAPSRLTSAPLDGVKKDDENADASAAEADATPAKRRRSTINQTPAQVKLLIAGRRRRSSIKPGKELTPGGLLRALSRMPDLPPPTPDEADDNSRSHTLAASTSSRRDSYIPNRASLLSNHSRRTSLASSYLAEEPSLSHSDSSPRSAGSNDASHADPSHRLSLASSHRSSVFSEAATASHAPRRSSIASVASVEAARRASGVADLSRFLVRRGRMSEAVSEMGEGSMMKIDEEMDEKGRYSMDPEGRFSMGSELGRDLSLAYDEHDSPGKASTSASRLSLASAYGNLSAGRLSLPVSLAGETEAGEVLGEEDGEVLGEADGDEPRSAAFEEDDFQQNDFGGGYSDAEADQIAADSERDAGVEEDDEDMGDRIPWADKGKGRASEVDGFGDEEDESVGATAGEGAYEGFEDAVRLPTPPPLAQVAINRKKRLDSAAKPKRTKKQRYTRTGEPVPDLPKSRQKALFQHFLGPGIKMDDEAVEALMDASQDFFSVLLHDASKAAKRAGRSSTINEADMIRAMKDHRLLPASLPVPSLARQLTADRELLDLIEQLGPDGLGVGVKRRRGGGGNGRKKRLEEVEEEEEEEEDEEEEEPPRPPPRKKRPSAAAAKSGKTQTTRSAKENEPAAKEAKKRRRSSTSTSDGRATKRRVSKAAAAKAAAEEPLDASSGGEDVFSD
ncbi:hypothetical protein JCM8097_005077 [Rhodosporidiobolus ruineniae]